MERKEKKFKLVSMATVLNPSLKTDDLSLIYTVPLAPSGWSRIDILPLGE